MKFFVTWAAGMLISLVVWGQTTVITNATYVDVSSAKVVADVTLVIEEGRIASISKRRVRVPEGARVIDATGKYLIPGLVDSHIHMFQSGGAYTRPDALNLQAHRPYDEEIAWVRGNAEDFFRRYMRQGITTVMDVGGPMTNFDIRDEFEGSPIAPYYFTTGPLISSYQPEAFDREDPPIANIQTPEQARAMVQQQAVRKPDFIKIWYIVFNGSSAEDYLPVVEATMDEASKFDIPVAVHATGLAQAKLAVKAGAKFLVHSVDEPIDEEFVSLLLENEVVLCPTLIVSRKYSEVFSQNNDLSAEDFRWANPEVIGSLFDLEHLPDTVLLRRYKEFASANLEDGGRLMKSEAIERANLKMLLEAGVMIATGTDAGNVGTQHATSYYQELEAMAEAGMDNFALLKASTLTPAEVFGQADEWGSIAEGKRADMVLLSADPTEDIEAIKGVEWVMKAGVLVDPDTLLQDTPETLVQRQLNAYNAGDIEAFVEPYADSVKLFRIGTEEPFIVGKEAMYRGYGPYFERTPDLHCELVNRMVSGNTVIDHERITFDDSGGSSEAMAIYKCDNGKIVEVYFWSPRPYMPQWGE